MNTTLHEKKKKWNRAFKFIFIASVLLLGMIGYGIYWAFFDMNRLPTGDFLTEVASPDGTYSVKAYLVNGGATTSFSIRGELVYHKENKKTQNIYWNYREGAANIHWIDQKTVVINDHTLDVLKDKYDFRKQ